MAAKKSTTKYYKFRGKVAYAKVYEPDDFRGDLKWKLNLYPDADVMLKMKATGLQNKWKDDDGGTSGVTGKFIGLARPTQKEFAAGVTHFLPPVIYDAKGGKLVWYEKEADGTVIRHGEKVIIGNGSLVEVELEVYQTTRFGAGSKFMSVKILDLIEYNPPEDLSENEVDLDDEIPFESTPTPVPEVKEVVDTPKTAKAEKKTKVAW